MAASLTKKKTSFKIDRLGILYKKVCNAKNVGKFLSMSIAKMLFFIKNVFLQQYLKGFLL